MRGHALTISWKEQTDFSCLCLLNFSKAEVLLFPFFVEHAAHQRESAIFSFLSKSQIIGPPGKYGSFQTNQFLMNTIQAIFLL